MVTIFGLRIDAHVALLGNTGLVIWMALITRWQSFNDWPRTLRALWWIVLLTVLAMSVALALMPPLTVYIQTMVSFT